MAAALRLALLAALFTLAGCTDREQAQTARAPRPLEFKVASAVVPASTFGNDPAEAAFYELFEAYAASEYDRRQPRETTVSAGIGACGLLRTGAVPENAVRTLQIAYRLTQDGATAAAAAATDTLCTDLRGYYNPVVRQRALAVKENLERVHGNGTVRMAPAYYNAGIACAVLDRGLEPKDAFAALRSDRRPYLSVREDEMSIRQMARVAELARCPQGTRMLFFGTPDG